MRRSASCTSMRTATCAMPTEGFEFSHASIMFNVLRDVPAGDEGSPRSPCADFSESEAALAASSGAHRHVRRPFARGRPFPRRDVGCAVPPHRRRAAAGGLREFRHRRLDLRKLPSHRNAGFRRPYVQPGRLAARYAHPLGTPYHRFRRGGGVPAPDERIDAITGARMLWKLCGQTLKSNES